MIRDYINQRSVKLYALTAQNNIKKDTEGVGLMDTAKETSMQKHKRFMSQAREISEYAEAFGPLEAMNRYDISTVQALQKILAKRGAREQLPLISKRAMFDTPQDYYDGLIQGVINRITKMQATIDERNKIIESLRVEIADLKNKQTNRSALEMVRQEKKLAQLSMLIKEG